jgi:hypothetical protein
MRTFSHFRQLLSTRTRQVALTVVTVSGVVALTLAGGTAQGSVYAKGAGTAHVSTDTTPYSGGRMMAADPSGGYWTVDMAGAMTSYGGAATFGSPALAGLHLAQPIVGMAATPDGKGYWLVASDGGIFSYGDAAFHGSTGAIHLNQPIVGMAATPDGKGYWLVASDGGIFTFGDAAFFGSTGAIHLNQPIVGMAATPSGTGYWLVASDGGIFTFGDAAFHGSTGAIHLNQPIVGMAATPDGKGYWLVASDGGIFTFGNASFLGSLGGSGQQVTGIIVNPTSVRYTLIATSGAAIAPPPASAVPTQATPLPSPTIPTPSTPTAPPTSPSPTTPTPTPSPTSGGLAPSSVFDLSEWNLTLPVDASGGTGGANGSQNAAAIIPSSQLVSGFSDAYFQLNSAKQLVFTSPSNGATTTPGQGSNHTRSELHENYTGPNAATNGCWTSTLGGTMQATAVITAASADSDEATIGQIHGNGGAAFALLIYDQAKQQILLNVYSDPSDSGHNETVIESNVALGQPISYQLSFLNGALTATANGHTISLTAGSGWDTYPVRFDLGAYSSAPNINNPSGDQTQVAFSSFSERH